MKLWELLKTKTKEITETSDSLGDGKAEFLGEGTYEEYEKEQEDTKSWREWVNEQLKR